MQLKTTTTLLPELFTIMNAQPVETSFKLTEEDLLSHTISDMRDPARHVSAVLERYVYIAVLKLLLQVRSQEGTMRRSHVCTPTP